MSFIWHTKNKARSYQRRFCFFLFLILCVHSSYSQSLQQKRRIADFFPLSPYAVSIDSLLHFFTSSPDFMIDSAHGENETHYFYLLGDYHTTTLFEHSPIAVKIELEARKTESFTYEIIAWYDSTQQKQVDKEFSRLQKQLSAISQSASLAPIQKGEPHPQFIYNFRWDKNSRYPDFFLVKDSMLVNGRFYFYITLCLNLTLSE